MKKKSFVVNLLYYIIPMVLIFPLSIWGIYQMDKATYDCFFVVGDSMNPTLAGSKENSTYGYSDNSDLAIDNLQRFDLVICYYPFPSSRDYQQPYISGHSARTKEATLKVKRVIGLPGDTLLIDNEHFTITDSKGKVTTYGEGNTPVPFERLGPIEHRNAEITLAENEYFVMGDNWTKNGSSDCCNPTLDARPAPIYRENIDGVIFKLTGICTYEKCKHCTSCRKIVEDDCKQCKCGGTDFLYYDDIIDERPYEDGPIYLK